MNEDDITVWVTTFPDRKALQLQWIDPATGKKKTQSAKTSSHRQAERAAGELEKELRAGRQPVSKIAWEDFCERYEDEALSGLADATAHKVTTVFNLITEILSPQTLRSLTAERISHFTAELRKGGKRGQRSDKTIKSYLAHLKAALEWAVSKELLPTAPKVDLPKRAKGAKSMKGRPITLEEFERMLAAVPTEFATAQAEAREDIVESWQHYLRGLWLSGLRLSESLELTWDDDGRLSVDLTGRRPMLRIPGELEKGNQDRLLPMAPEFAEFLLATHDEARTGYVFNPKPRRPQRCERVQADRACRVIMAIGKAAGVKVHTEPKTRNVKYASAHDLRRSFGERWAVRIMPKVLQELMRHESIETTLKYYVGQNAQSTADLLWEAHQRWQPDAIDTGSDQGSEGGETSNGNTFGNSQVSEARREA